MGSAPGGLYPAHTPDDNDDHELVPRPGTCFSMAGMNTGLPANLNNSNHYPVEAMCQGCDEMIESAHFYAQWSHTGRKPGDPR